MAATFRLPPKVCAVITFVLVFLAVVLIFWGLGYLLSRFVQLLFLGGLNRVAGGLFGLIQGCLLLAVVLFALADGGAPKFLQPALQRSQLAPPFIRLGGKIFRGGHRAFEEWR
jgi:membrane protein required for colicin V production